jgi:excisionase family DNA binding protein
LVDAVWVAERLGVTLRFVRRLVAERRIPYIKLGKPVRFERADVERFIQNRRRAQARTSDVPAVPAVSRRVTTKRQSAPPKPRPTGA